MPTGLTTAVSGLTATVLGDNTVLLAGGLNGSGAPVASAELYDPSQNAFVALPKMIKARSHHTATLLNNGTVLIAGGRNSAGPLASLEIFNPSSRTFTAAAALKHARQDHTATLLTDGTVLIAGGSNSSGPLASAEIYNPATNKVTATGSLSTARTLASASMLLDFNGDVLIEGGQDANGNDLGTAEEFDPITGTFATLTAQMITARSGHLGLTLPYNGKVLIAGGTSAGAPVAASELYDPIVQAFVDNGEMNVARDEFAANFFAVPAVGQVLMSGGLDNTGTPRVLTDMFSYPTIRTDQPDYPPGSPVIIYGAGFAPLEQVTTVIEGSNGENDVETDTADSTGSFTDYNFQIADTDGGVTFVMTATGATSGLTAQDRFTDNVSSVTLTNSIRDGYRRRDHRQLRCYGQFFVQYRLAKQRLSQPQLCPQGRPRISEQTPSPSAAFSSGNVTSTLTITTTCGTTPPGTSTFTVTATGTGGSATSSSATLVVRPCGTSTALTSGTSWTVPPGVSSVTAECIGAGGNGSTGSSSTHGGGGGAGGDYAELATLSVTAGNTITYQLGAAGGTTTTTGATWFNSTSTIVYGQAPVAAQQAAPAGLQPRQARQATRPTTSDRRNMQAAAAVIRVLLPAVAAAAVVRRD